MTKHPVNKPTGAGKSSFGLIDTVAFFQELGLKKGITFLDVACGRGAYSLAIADIVGENGQVYAVDLWEEGIGILREEAASKGIQNMTTFVSDVAQHMPVEDDSVDVCLMATVLHDLVQEGDVADALKEVGRVLKPNGVFAVVEFKKQDGPPGPPKSIRMRLEDVSALLLKIGFIRFSGVVELGPQIYFAQFRRLSNKP